MNSVLIGRMAGVNFTLTFLFDKILVFISFAQTDLDRFACDTPATASAISLFLFAVLCSELCSFVVVYCHSRGFQVGGTFPGTILLGGFQVSEIYTALMLPVLK